MTFTATQQLDQLGELEVFSWDLFPTVAAEKTRHLDSDGLPKLGVNIHPGMILVGKIGKTREYDPTRAPTPLEIHGLDLATLQSKYGRMWYDASLYAPDGTSGVVVSASLISVNNKMCAIVEIE